MNEEYPYPLLNKEDGKVSCQLCGKSFLVITPRHLSTHNVTYSEYKMRFPNAPLSCEEFAIRGKYGKDKDLFMEQMIEEETIVEEEWVK